ncbi:unnamed protein product, partial [Callosobruchus maculatus]
IHIKCNNYSETIGPLFDS